MSDFLKSSLCIVFILCLNLFSCKEKETEEFEISDLAVISDDTLVIVNKDYGMKMSSNGTKTWVDLNDDTHFDQISVDSNNILWGLDYWMGIHESSYCKIYYSLDFGRSWNLIYDSNSSPIFVKIISGLNKPLLLFDSHENIFAFSKNNLNEAEYHNIGKNPDSGFLMSEPFKVSRDGFLFKRNPAGLWDSLVRLKNVTIATDILNKNDTVFVVGGGYGGYKGYVGSRMPNGQIKEYSVNSIQIAGIRTDSTNRIWIFGDGGVFLKDGDSIARRSPNWIKK